jgi:ATP-binding cassette subfamily B protein
MTSSAKAGTEKVGTQNAGTGEAGPPLGATAPDPHGSLPPALSSMWRLCRLGYRYEPRLMGVAFGLSLLSAIPDALLALWLKLLGDGVTGGQQRLVYVALVGLAGSACATWFLGVISIRLQRRFRDKVTIALESHVARLQASVATIAHHERPEYLDRLSVLRNQIFVLDHMYMSVFATAGWILRLGITISLLASISPVLILLALCAAPTVLTASWRPGVERDAQERGAPAQRLARHLFVTATTAAPGKEVRVTGIGQRLIRDRYTAWQRWYTPVAAARSRSAIWHALAWAVFGLGYVGAVVYVSTGSHASPGNVLLVLAAGARLSAYVGATVGEIGFLRGIWLDGSRRLVWLEQYAASLQEHTDGAVPHVLGEGIRLEQVSFTYPGSGSPVLREVNLFLPAGSVVAIVGENGAGKSTLVKLLSKFYSPSSGRILVDGADLDRMPADAWRARLSGAYQDFFRLEFLAQHSVGLGDLPRYDLEQPVRTAVERAGAQDVVAGLRDGLSTQLGPGWPDGVDVSFGQWQKVALARGFMRDEPLLLVLDEPTAALDAETEHALFERYAAGARRGPADRGSGPAAPSGRITILVSHRFSTVRMADLIVVLDGSRVAEVGTHEALVAQGGQYAQLYAIQAEAYR